MKISLFSKVGLLTKHVWVIGHSVVYLRQKKSNLWYNVFLQLKERKGRCRNMPGERGSGRTKERKREMWKNGKMEYIIHLAIWGCLAQQS